MKRLREQYSRRYSPLTEKHLSSVEVAHINKVLQKQGLSVHIEMPSGLLTVSNLETNRPLSGMYFNTAIQNLTKTLNSLLPSGMTTRPLTGPKLQYIIEGVSTTPRQPKKEGTWAVPDDLEKIIVLRKLLAKPFPVGDQALRKQLYGALGNDDLFDLLDQEAKRDPQMDGRSFIILAVEKLIQTYKSNPQAFKNYIRPEIVAQWRALANIRF